MRKKIKVDWIKSSIMPPESGEYYKIRKLIKSRNDIWGDDVEDSWEVGDYEVSADFWSAENGMWGIDLCSGYGEPDNHWEVVAWAYLPKPRVPEPIFNKTYFLMGDKACKEIIYEPTMEESNDENQT